MSAGFVFVSGVGSSMKAVSGSPSSSGSITLSTCGPTRFARRQSRPGLSRAHDVESFLEAGNVLGIVEDLLFGKAGEEIDELRLR